MKTHIRKKYLVPALFTCGMLSLTTGIVAAVQQEQSPREQTPSDPAPAGSPLLTIQSDSIRYYPNATAADRDSILGPHTEEILKKDVDNASAWLTLVDNGQYEESYRQLAYSTQSAYTREDWLGILTLCRQNIKKTGSRTYISMNYVMGVDKTIQFDTVFNNNQHMTETLILLKQNDASWKVARYTLEKKVP